MEQFISTIENEKAAASLLRALSGSKPFRRFKEALSCYPEIREEWFSFKQEKLKEWIMEELALEIEEREKTGIKITFLPFPGEI